MTFQDVTEAAGVACAKSWCFETTTADVNGDGFLYIYVCRAYYENPNMGTNQLFINNGDATFV